VQVITVDPWKFATPKTQSEKEWKIKATKIKLSDFGKKEDKSRIHLSID
jgi:hypothetical protein